MESNNTNTGDNTAASNSGDHTVLIQENFVPETTGGATASTTNINSNGLQQQQVLQPTQPMGNPFILNQMPPGGGPLLIQQPPLNQQPQPQMQMQVPVGAPMNEPNAAVSDAMKHQVQQQVQQQVEQQIQLNFQQQQAQQQQQQQAQQQLSQQQAQQQQHQQQMQEEQRRQLMLFNPMSAVQPQTQFVFAPQGTSSGAPPGFVIPNQMMASQSFLVPHPNTMLNSYAAAAPGFVQANMPVLLQVNPAAQQQQQQQQGAQPTQHLAGLQQQQQPYQAAQVLQAHPGMALAQQTSNGGVLHHPMTATQHHQSMAQAIIGPPSSKVDGVLDIGGGKKRGIALEGQPIRPLSAYNFFFSDERENVLKEDVEELQKGSKTKDKAEGDETDKDADNEEKDAEEKDSTDKDSTEEPTKEKVRDTNNEPFEEKKKRLLAQHVNKDRTKRRPHRKTHGKIGFTDLSKIIGKRWRELPNEKKQIYKDIAKADLERYQKEVAEFNNERLSKRPK